MAAGQAGTFNIQEFADDGTPLSGGRLYTYITGTTTQKTAYTDPAGTVPHTYVSDGAGGQYIALNSRGELPAPLYLSPDSAYDLALKRSDGSAIWTRRAEATGASIVAADDGASGSLWTTVQGFINKIISSAGSSVIGFTQAGTGAVVRKIQDKLRENVSVKDFGAVGDSVTDDTASIQAAINYCILYGCILRVPATSNYYKIAGTLTINHSINIIGEGAGPGNQYAGNQNAKPQFVFTGTGVGINIPATSADGPQGVILENLTLRGNAATTWIVKAIGNVTYTAAFLQIESCFIYGATTGYGLGIYYCTSNTINRTIIETCGVACQLDNAHATVFTGSNLEQSLIGLDAKNCFAVTINGGSVQGCNYGRITSQSLAMPADFYIYPSWGTYRDTLAEYAGTGIRNFNTSITINGLYIEGNTWSVVNENAGTTIFQGGYVEIDNPTNTTGDKGFIDIRDGGILIDGVHFVANALGAGFVGLINGNGANYAAPFFLDNCLYTGFTTAQILTGAGVTQHVGVASVFEVSKFRKLCSRTQVLNIGGQSTIPTTSGGGAQPVDLSTSVNGNNLFHVVANAGATTVTYSWTETATQVAGTEISLTVATSSGGTATLQFSSAFKTDAASYVVPTNKYITFDFRFTNGVWVLRSTPIVITQ